MDLPRLVGWIPPKGLPMSVYLSALALCHVFFFCGMPECPTLITLRNIHVPIAN